MVGGLRRIGQDFRRGRHLDAYLVAAGALTIAVLSLMGDVITDDVRWAAVLASLGLLVYQLTVPDHFGDYDDCLRDRTAFEGTTFASRLNAASRVWVFAPSAVNLLTASTPNDLRRTVLARHDGLVRIAVLDPSAAAAVELAQRQLDDAVDFPIQSLPDALASTVARLKAMTRWHTPGQLEHRFVGGNPGFSLVAVDPHTKDGVLIVEFHGFHNEATGSRMHIELRRRDSEHWFAYWVDQFEHLWAAAREPDADGG